MPELEQQRLEAERSQLLASLCDAAEEHERGELDQASFEAIDERDRLRLGEVDARLASLEAEARLSAGSGDAEIDATPTARRGSGVTEGSWFRRHRVSVVLGALVLVLAGLLAAVLLGGSSSSDSSSSIPALLSSANAYEQQGKIAEALQLYTKVLAIDPSQPQALAEAGWLTFEAGAAARSSSLISRGEAEVRASVAADPQLYASRLYLGAILLLAHNDAPGALAQFKDFLALKPPAAWVETAQPYLDKAASMAGVPVPTTTP